MDQQAERFASEIPVNLPRNRAEPEYGSDLICDLLQAMGFEHVMLTPGSSFRGLHDSLVNYTRNDKPRIILCGAEEIALHMAQGYSKVTGKASLVILHDLVGLQHAMMAFYNAWADEVPVLVLGGSGPADPAERRAIDWLHSANTQSESVRPYTKWTDEPVTLKAVFDSVLRARRIAESAPRRPTYVSVDAGLQEDRLDDPAALPDVDLPRYRPAPPVAAAESEVATAADLLTEASMPLVFGGRFGRRAEAGPPLVRLIELLGAAYQDGTDIVCVPTSHPQNLNSGYRSPPNPIRGESDVVLGIDCPDLTALVGGYAGARGDMRNAMTGERKVIDLSVNDLGVDHWSNAGGGLAPLDVQLLAEPLHGLHQLLAEVERRAKGEPFWYRRAQERRRDLAGRHEALRATQRERAAEDWDATPISVPRMMGELWRAVRNEDWVLVTRNGRCWYEGIWDFPGAGRFLGHNGGGGVGYGPGGVVGAALALRKSGRFPLAILGDGDFTMNPSALWTAAHYRIPCLVVLHNNTSFGNDEEHQIALAQARGRPVENAWIGQRMVAPEPDYAAIARGYGAWGAGPIVDPSDLEGAFRDAVAEVARGGVALVDVHTQLK